ncbi:MAG: Flp family type IVb pilin [Gaiellaceae bacterium]
MRVHGLSAMAQRAHTTVPSCLVSPRVRMRSVLPHSGDFQIARKKSASKRISLGPRNTSRRRLEQFAVNHIQEGSPIRTVLRICSTIRFAFRCEQGQAMAEYALILSLVMLVALATLAEAAGQVLRLWETATSVLP